MSSKLGSRKEKEPKPKLNKETLEATLTQIEYLKPVKKDLILALCKAFDGKVTDDDIEEYHKLFVSMDTEEANQMPITQLGTCMRILQQVPTDNEVNQLIELVNPKKDEATEAAEKAKKAKSAKKPSAKSAPKGGAKGASAEEEPEVEKIDFYKFLLAMAIYMRDPEEIAADVKKAFRALDRSNQGYIMSVDLREFLSKLGDCLTDEEMDEMIRIADIESNGQIHYDQFVDTMLAMKTGKKKKSGKGKKGKGKKGKK